METKYSLGLDLSKKDFKACLVVIDHEQNTSIKASRTFPNTASGFSQLWEWAEKKRKKGIPFSVVMEATGVYHENLAWFLHKKHVDLSIVLPNRSKAYMTSLGHKSKNDKVDARGLAMMGSVQKLALWKPISQEIYQLRALTRHLEDLQNMRTGLLNQQEQVKHAMYSVSEVEKSLKKTIKAVDKQAETCKKKIRETLYKDNALSVKAGAITSIKGVSDMTAAVVIAETNGFALIRNLKQLTSYAGYDVSENQSGQKAGKTRITKKGNAHIRRAMHLPAFNVVRYNVKPFVGLYERVYDRSGIKMKAYVAVQSKLLSMMYTLWKGDTAFDQNLHDRVESINQDAKFPLPVLCTGNGNKIAPEKSRATLGGHLSDRAANVPLPVYQI
jgi:transposase